MLNKEEYDKLGNMLKEGLITKRTRQIVSEAVDRDEVVKAIITLIADKVALARYKISFGPELTKLVGETVFDRSTLFLGRAEEKSLLELLNSWEKIIEAIDVSRDYEVSIVLSQGTYGMIREFLGKRILPAERFIAVNPIIKNVFIDKPWELTKETMKYFSGIDAKIINDSVNFTEEAQGTMIVCADINSGETGIIDLLCGALAKGIFLIIRGCGHLDMDSLIALKEAIDKSSIPDGQEAICLSEDSSSKLFTKPFNPSLLIGGGKKRDTEIAPLIAKICGRIM